MNENRWVWVWLTLAWILCLGVCTVVVVRHVDAGFAEQNRQAWERFDAVQTRADKRLNDAIDADKATRADDRPKCVR